MAKQQRKATYQTRLDRVVDHTYRRLDEDILPEGLACGHEGRLSVAARRMVAAIGPGAR